MNAIDWKSIRTFKGSQNKGFEQLCFQLALRMYGDKGNFTEVDDTGGGDGVEFYQTRAVGKEWGWQAKFYDQSIRLNVSGRKGKIINSLKKSLRVHPNLEKWILCTNSQFTPVEQKWFDTELKKIIPRQRMVKLEHWSEGKIQNLLDKPENNGIKNAFFGKLQLTPYWFLSRFNKVRHLVEEKYVQELHTKDNNLYYDYLGPLLVNYDFIRRCEQNLNSLKADFKRHQDDIHSAKEFSFSGIEWPAKKQYFEHCNKGIEIISNTLSELNNILRLITPNEITHTKNYDAERFQKPLREVRDTLDKIFRNNSFEFSSDYNPKDDDEKNRLISIRNKMSQLAYSLESILDEIFYFIRDIGMSYNHHLHVLGNAGIGKTHICTSLATEYLDKKFPVIFIPGIKFTEHATIENQFLELLDIKSNYSFDEFLEILNVLGRVYNVRVPIIIDGLNESVNDRGILNPIWKRDIRGLEQQIGNLSNVVLLTTCRSSYQKEIWSKDAISLHLYYGFTNEVDKKALIKKYLDKYRIISDLTYLSLSNFSHPLFLKIFCETKSKPNEDVYVQIGDDSIYDIFGQFIRKCDMSVYDRLKGYGAIPGTQNREVASKISTIIGKKLWESKSRLLNFESYRELFGEPMQQNYFISKAKALIDEGLLLVRDWENQQEHVGFTYDMIGGYCIANYLIDTYHADMQDFISTNDFIDRLVSENYETRHPLAEDILEYFIALFPAKTGQHLMDFLPAEEKFRKVRNDSFLALFKLSGQFITSKEVKKAESAFEKSPFRQRELLLERSREIFFVPSHPLNFRFFSKRLFSLSLTEKDLCWCEFLRNSNESNLDDIICEFEAININGNTFKLPEQEDVNDIVAEFLVWSLGSNMIKFRDDASKALYKYGRQNPMKFYNLLSKFVAIDDMYIRERLLAIAFGLVSAACKEGDNSNFVETAVQWSYKMFFKARARFATTHILLRDYACLIIETGCRNYPGLKKSIDINLARAPFSTGGIRKWKIAKDKNKKEYSEGNSLIDFFFQKDELVRLTKSNFYKPDKKAEEAKGRILWRAYNLGYKFNDFKEIDQRIARWYGKGRDDGKRVEKYGEKYVWIAYYELAGYMSDNGLLTKPYTSKFPVRLFGERFDPTFPEPQTERQYFDVDIIGNRQISFNAWLNKDNAPDINRLLVVNDLTEEKEQFILMDASKCQTDEKSQRQVFFWLTPILVDLQQYESAKAAILSKSVDVELKPAYHEIIYNGEYPNSEYFPKLGKTQINWAFKKVKVKSRYSKVAIFKNHKELSDKKQAEFWKEMEEKFSFTDSRSSNYQKEYRNDKNELVAPFSVRIVQPSTPPDLNTRIAAEASGRGFTIKRIYKYIDELEDLTKPVIVNMPTISSQIGTTIAKEITQALKLESKPGTTDLFDSKGKRASVSFRHGDKYTNYHTFLYLRKDLLDLYLKRKRLNLFWSYKGEWNHYMADGIGQYSNKPHWRTFSKTVDYNPESKTLTLMKIKVKQKKN